MYVTMAHTILNLTQRNSQTLSSDHLHIIFGSDMFSHTDLKSVHNSITYLHDICNCIPSPTSITNLKAKTYYKDNWNNDN